MGYYSRPCIHLRLPVKAFHSIEPYMRCSKGLSGVTGFAALHPGLRLVELARVILK